MSTYTLYHCDFTVQYDMPDRLAIAISAFEYLCRSNCCELKHSSQKYPGLWNFEVIANTEEDRDSLYAKAREVFSHKSMTILGIYQ